MYATYQITIWRLVYGNQLQKYVSNISKENSTGGKSINKKTGSSQNETFCRKGEVTL